MLAMVATLSSRARPRVAITLNEKMGQGRLVGESNFRLYPSSRESVPSVSHSLVIFGAVVTLYVPSCNTEADKVERKRG